MAIHYCSSQGAKRNIFFQDLEDSYGSNEGQILKIISLFVSLRRTKKIDLNQNLLKEKDQFFDSKKVYLSLIEFFFHQSFLVSL